MEIVVKNLSFSYDAKRTPNVLKEINISFQQGEFVGIAGHSGSGKSTFIQLLKGLLKPTEGEILIQGANPHLQKRYELYNTIGFLFQYPEHQLFASTVFEDIAFGLKNQSENMKDIEIEKRVKEAMHKVNLDFNSFKHRHPLDLSGGEKRRVALAGVLALRPQTIILDEPTVGLDFPSRTALFKVLHQLNNTGVTILLVTHRWEEIISHTERLVVFKNGSIIKDGKPLTVLSDVDFLHDNHLKPLPFIALNHFLQNKGLSVSDQPWDVDQVAQVILKSLGVKK
ncbi:hypothetical protein BEP19_02370 [Ammoniphilus oxalaticus]|uniref:ABC transporter domain-containing protein n=1 Tax=Ammoniphilus oxalaticus TaxID=66863 RepID=A0A419SNH0_9BACL|nr:ATP-binding cassette domain-containing protein [Ammoniphilus oxalaticus]RKD25803.1 hypothetical protein BEP19_02370 [Ammoniphilus oxalaticus]